MPNNYFQFKQFLIRQDKALMKVGTDGVLLGAWTNANNAREILDIGTGTGLIALMIAQRYDCRIDAVEVEEDSYIQAYENFQASKWATRLRAIHTSVQEYARTSTKKYEHITSNPPFFTTNKSSKSPATSSVKHALLLSHEDLLNTVNELLSHSGLFSTVLPTEEGRQFIEKAKVQNLYLSRITKVRTSITHSSEKRLLMEFSRKECNYEKKEIVLEMGTRNSKSEEYQKLVKDFYLDPV